MNFAKYRVQLSTEKKYSSKYEYKYKYEYSIPACGDRFSWVEPVFVCLIDSLRPINNLSVIKGQIFLD